MVIPVADVRPAMKPTIVERGPMTVAGVRVRYDGDDSVFEHAWTEFGERWEGVETRTDAGEAFGVVTGVENDRRAFDYVAGVAAADASGVPAGFAAVNVDGGTYAGFETTLASFRADHDEAHEWLVDAGYERPPGAEFEHYGPEYDPDDPDSRLRYFLPIRPL